MWVSSTYYVNRRRTWLVPPKHDVLLVIVDRSAKHLSRVFVKEEGWACSTEILLVLVFCWFAFLLCLWFCAAAFLSFFLIFSRIWYRWQQKEFLPELLCV